MHNSRWVGLHAAFYQQQQHPFNSSLSGSTRASRYQKGKTNLHLLKQERVRGSGISWTICKSAPRPRQMTTPASHHSIFRLAHLVWEPSVLVAASVVCRLSRVRSRKLREIHAKFRRPYRKLGSPSKNTTSDFAPELAKYPQKGAAVPKIVQNSVRAYCLALLSDAACLQAGCPSWRQTNSVRALKVIKALLLVCFVGHNLVGISAVLLVLLKKNIRRWRLFRHLLSALLCHYVKTWCYQLGKIDYNALLTGLAGVCVDQSPREVNPLSVDRCSLSRVGKQDNVQTTIGPGHGFVAPPWTGYWQPRTVFQFPQSNQHTPPCIDQCCRPKVLFRHVE